MARSAATVNAVRGSAILLSKAAHSAKHDVTRKRHDSPGSAQVTEGGQAFTVSDAAVPCAVSSVRLSGAMQQQHVLDRLLADVDRREEEVDSLRKM